MNNFRKILYPFSLVYDEITKARNKAYDKNILPSYTFEVPVIGVGNLSVGGTGKTPMIEYLIRLLYKDYRTAVLSRGYKRKSKGFILADEGSTFETLGDEPIQFYRKFRNITVAVDADRVNGIKQLLNQKPAPEVILLDDVLQHRKVNPGFTILLTSYDKLYTEDSVLPSGDLRENINGAKRSQIIVVTKCPDKLSENEQFEISKKLKPEPNQTIFFTSIAYNDKIRSASGEIELSDLKKYQVLLLTGIAKTKPLTDFLSQKEIEFTHISFPDHHNFSSRDIQSVRQQFDKIQSEKKILLTTEKDYVRLSPLLTENVYFLPIETYFITNEKDFNKLILDYVRKNSRNC
ncbi:MAG: tetraacyldisaccharide 4'-kinase [Flavobacteriaceae bacterium]|nr:tetraacyldisaccharide 4'-kinase [Flavobacteriaceae bacterium]